MASTVPEQRLPQPREFVRLTSTRGQIAGLMTRVRALLGRTAA